MASAADAKWSADQVVLLIDSYKEESCLYAFDSPNYHNKHLRREALKRIRDAVQRLKPEVSEKECSSKFHSLRTQFNTESKKISASLKSGTGTDNVYEPSLWYFKYLSFLNPYLTTRKSRNSIYKETSDEVEDINKEQNSQYSIDNFEYDSQPPLIDTTENYPAPNTPGPSLGLSQSPTSAFISTGTARFDLENSLSPAPNTPSLSSGTPDRRLNKRKATNADEYTGAIKSLADSLRQPIVIANSKNTPVDDGVDGYLKFLGSVLRSINCEELRLTLMQKIMEMAINTRTTDLQKSRLS